MATELLLEILYGVLIVLGIVAIAAFWRLFEVLSDFKEISTILKKRSKQLDQKIAQVTDTFSNFVELIKGFFYSLGFVKTIKKAMEENNKEGDHDGK